MTDDYWWDQRYAAMYYDLSGRQPGETLRILVTGSRYYGDGMALWTAMNAAAGPLSPVIVHGRCDPRDPVTRRTVRWDLAVRMTRERQAALLGADWLAHVCAQERGWREDPHPADWDQYGRRAGFIRNALMVESGAHKCIAAAQPGEANKGTRHCADLAAKAEIPVTWVPYPLDPTNGHV